MYKNIICIFLLKRDKYLNLARERRNWSNLKCTSGKGELKRAEMHTHRGPTVRFFCETSLPFCFEIFSRLYNFPGVQTIIVVTRPANELNVDTLLSSMPSLQLSWHFRWGYTSFLFPFGNRYTSFYTTHTTWAAFPLRYLRPVYFWEQVHVLLYHTCNLCGMSKESTGRYPTHKYYLIDIK